MTLESSIEVDKLQDLQRLQQKELAIALDYLVVQLNFKEK